MTWKHHNCRQKYQSNSCLPKLAPNAGLWRIWVRNLRKIFIVSEKHKMVHFYFRSHAAIIAERRRHIFSRHYYIIHPLSIFQKYWETFMGLILLMYIFNSVFFLTYAGKMRYDNYGVQQMFWYVNSINLLYNVYCVMNMFTGYICDKTKEIVLDHRRIAVHYLKTYFFIDLLSFSSIFNATTYFMGVKSMSQSYFVVIKFLTIIRLKTCVEYLRWIIEILQPGEITYAVIRTGIVCLYLLHYNSCLIIIISDIALQHRGQNINSWLVRTKLDYNETLTVPALYLHSVAETLYVYNTHHLGFTIQEETEDIVLEMLTIICATAIRMWIIMTIFRIMRVIYNSSIAYSIKMKEVRQLVLHRQLSVRTMNQLQIFYSHAFHNHYYNKRSLLKKLSMPLKYEIFVECSKSLIDNCSLFRGLPRTLTITLAHNLRIETFFAEEIIYVSGDYAPSMYLIAYGSVAVYDAKGREMLHLRDGDYFGEAALLFDEWEQKRDKTVVVLEFTEMYVLDKTAFKDIVSMNSDLATHMQTLLLKRNKLQR